jgi:hypothetical protein
MRREAVVDASAMRERRWGETARRCRLSGKKMEWIRGRGARAAGQRPGSEDNEAGSFVFPFCLQMDALKGFCGLPCCIFFVYGL